MLKVITYYVILIIPITLSKPRQYSLKPHTTFTSAHATYNAERRHHQTIDRYQQEMEDRQWDLEWKKQADKVKKQRAKKETTKRKWSLEQEKPAEEWMREIEKVSREWQVWAEEQELIRKKEIATQTAEALKETIPRDNKRETVALKENTLVQEYGVSQKLKQNAKQKEREEAANAKKMILKAIELTRQKEKEDQKAAKQKENAIKEEMARLKENAVKVEIARLRGEYQEKVTYHRKKAVTKPSKPNKNVSENNHHVKMVRVVEPSEQENVTEKKNKQEQAVTVTTEKLELDKPDSNNNEDFFFRIGKYERDDSLAYDLDGHGLRISWD